MPKKNKKEQKEDARKIARKNIEELFSYATIKFNKNKELANRYVKIALLTKNKGNVKLTKQQKSLFCKKCHSLIVPGVNCTVRIKNKFVIYHCFECGNLRKFGLRGVKQIKD